MRLTEIIECTLITQAEINEELITHIDLNDPKTRESIIELRKQQKDRNQPYLWE
jgi:hypothetical protein